VVVTALRGGLGFLSQLPVGTDEAAWDAFCRSPAVFPLVGYIIGALVAVALLLPIPGPTVAVGFVAWLYLVTGINHLDGVADFGDAVVVHGNASERREIMRDTTVGVGGVLAVVVVVFGIGMAGFALAAAPRAVLGIVVAAEVSAKLGMAAIACLGRATHDGFGAQLTAESEPSRVIIPTLIAVPAGLLTWPNPWAAISLLAGLATTAAVFWWSSWRLGGVSGDVFGASNELARVVALHAGVVAWLSL